MSSLPATSPLTPAIEYREAGRFQDAAAWLTHWLVDHPADAEAHALLAHVYLLDKQDALATVALSAAQAIAPGLPAVLRNQAWLALKGKDIAQALARAGAAAQADPASAENWLVQAAAIAADRRDADALPMVEHALQLRPTYAEAYANRAMIRLRAGNLDGALADAEHTIALKPHLTPVLGLIASLREQIAKRDGAVSAATANSAPPPDRSQPTAPSLPDIPAPTAAVCHEMAANAIRHGNLAEAEQWVRKALAIEPGNADAHFSLGTLLEQGNRTAEAAACFATACELAPHHDEYHWRAALLLPRVAPSAHIVAAYRERFAAGIETLGARDCLRANPVHVAGTTNAFYLAYHDADDRPLLESLSRLFRAKIPALGFTAPHLATWQAPPAGERIRVGFCSEFLVAHTIGKLYQGYLRHLDRARFEVILVHAPGARRDVGTAAIDQLADRVIQLAGTVADQQHQLAAEKLDVLFYPDLGMSPHTYFLAHARLAPVQAVSWGHPDTSGIDSIDYFLSAASIEPEGAQAHYSERLIRFHRLPSFYQPFAIPRSGPTRSELGLPASGTLYGCPQSLFKFHPDFDPVLAEIAHGDPSGHIVIIESTEPAWQQALVERWASTHPVLNERVVFLPRLGTEAFMAFMARLDVVLDPIHFGSGNTLYEAIVYGKPIITWPGRFMRGRIVSGAYQQMGIADAPVAQTLADYAPLALAYGRDPTRRATLFQACVDHAHKLFTDFAAVRELEDFLSAAVDAAARGEKLPQDWRPEPTALSSTESHRPEHSGRPRPQQTPAGIPSTSNWQHLVVMNPAASFTVPMGAPNPMSTTFSSAALQMAPPSRSVFASPATAVAPRAAGLPGPFAGDPSVEQSALARRETGRDAEAATSQCDRPGAPPDDAEQHALRALALTPPNTAPVRQLAAALHEQGDPARAERLLQHALTRVPHDLAILEALAALCAMQRQWADAERWIRHAIERHPHAPALMCQLAAILDAQQRGDETIATLQRAHERAPHDVAVMVAMANLLAKHQRWAEATDWLERAREQAPANPIVMRQLGIVLDELQQPVQALASLTRALQHAPEDGETVRALARHHHRQAHWVEAEQWTRKALQLNPSDLPLSHQLGIILDELRRPDEALVTLQAAHAMAPADPSSLRALANHHLRHEQWGAAEDWVRRALGANPDDAKAHCALGIILERKNRLDEAEHQYQTACRLDEDEIEYPWRAALMLPQVLRSSADISRYRARYRDGIEHLSALPHRLEQPVSKPGAGQAFYLAYHGADDRPLLEALSTLFRQQAPQLQYTAPHVDGWQAPGATRRIRLGICSEFMVGHTIGKLYQGVLRHLDRARFEVSLIHAPLAKQDVIRAEIDKLADHVVQLAGTLAEQQRQIAAEALDVIFYPDIGMSATTYFLAHARLAPVQAVSWGHPNTTGIDTLDYFVSAASIEPDGAEQLYTERLVLLDRLPCYYQPLIVPTRIEPRTALGLPAHGALYGCPQSLFKLHPEFDAVLAAIVDGDPQAHLVFLEGSVPGWQDTLRTRWQDTHPVLNQRALFLPRVGLERFMALMTHFDVLLDPIHFGSGNTLYEAMVYGKPIVTWPGHYMRGRIVAGAYQQMGVADAPVAARLEDYAPLAIAFAHDHARQRAFKAACVKGGAELFADLRAVRAFEAFFSAAVEACARGEKLPSGWRADTSNANTSNGISSTG